MTFPTHISESDIRDYDLMLRTDPLYDVVRVESPVRVVLRSRAMTNGRFREGVWVLSKGFVRAEHDCVVCRRTYGKRDQARMYRPPLDYPQEMRCCEGCVNDFGF